MKFSEQSKEIVFDMILASARHDGPALNQAWRALPSPSAIKDGFVLLVVIPGQLTQASYPARLITPEQAAGLAKEIWEDLSSWFPVPPDPAALGEVLVELTGAKAKPRALPTEVLKWRPIVAGVLLRRSPATYAQYRELLDIISKRFEKHYEAAQAESNRRTGRTSTIY